MIYDLNNGQWTPLDTDPVVTADGADYNAAVRKAGYFAGDSSDLDMVIVWEGSGDNALTQRYPYMVEFAPLGGDVHIVWCRSVQDFLTLAPTVYAMRTNDRINAVVETAELFLQRAFRAWHGHDLQAACPQCDPSEHERRRRAADERRRQNLEEGTR